MEERDRERQRRSVLLRLSLAQDSPDFGWSQRISEEEREGERGSRVGTDRWSQAAPGILPVIWDKRHRSFARDLALTREKGHKERESEEMRAGEEGP